MNFKRHRYRGGSTIFNLVLLVAAAYGLYVGIQYAPQWLESRSVQSILDDLVEAQQTDPARSPQVVQAKVIRMLQVNDMNTLTDQFEVTGTKGSYVITFRYDRDLNLGYTTRTIHYEYSVRL
jgi:hypothetical protein